MTTERRAAVAAVTRRLAATTPSTEQEKPSATTAVQTQPVIQSDMFPTKRRSTTELPIQETSACQEWSLLKQLGRETPIYLKRLPVTTTGAPIKQKVVLDQNILMHFP